MKKVSHNSLDTKAQLDSNNIGIAVVGMSCRFPGASGYKEFWTNLEQGVDSIKEISADRWDVSEHYSSNRNEPNKSVSKWCGLVDNIYDFDNQFFKISPREANNMDPQQRLLLEETWHCIEESGIPLSLLQKRITSVYIGEMTVDYGYENLNKNMEIDSYMCMGIYDCMLANRISYLFNFSGTSVSLNAACASSIIAIHEAKRSLINKECNYAIAGSVNLNIHPMKYISFSKSHMLSPDGKCKTFDKDANGYVPGDGVGVLLLQRLDEAIRDGNHIYGIIKGSATNHVGRSISPTAPSVKAQREVILAAYSDAGLSPETVSYVEAHGTGTSLGDPIEIEALTQAFRQHTSKNQFCNIGSVKTNIGHLEAAAGMAGVIKVLLMLKQKKIPKSLNINELNPVIEFEKTPFTVSTCLSKWKGKEEGMPLRAGVSSFGFGGANSHLVIEEYIEERIYEDFLLDRDNIFILSANTQQNLESLLSEWKNFVMGEDFESYLLKDICNTLLTGRENYPYRYGILVESKENLKRSILSDNKSFQKSKRSSWCICIGALPWNSYEDIRELVDELYLFEHNLNNALIYLDSIDTSQKIRKSFYEKTWTGRYRQLYLFISGYAYIVSLQNLGFSSDLIMGEKEGFWVALAVSGIVKLEDVIAILSAKKELEKIKFFRPSMPFYDQVNQKKIMPFHFDEEYLRLITKDLDINDDILSYYIKKARLLNESQYTFKKYIDEWSITIKAISGYEIVQMIYDEKFLTHEKDKSTKEKNLLAVVIVSSLRQLKQRWDLTEENKFNNPRFYELINLIADGIMPKEIMVDILISENPNFISAVKILNHRQSGINLENSYDYLKDRNQHIEEIANTTDWIKSAFSTRTVLSFTEDMESLKLGDFIMNQGNSNINVDGFRSIKETLLQLWLKGVDIEWEKLFHHKTFKRVSLPVCCFDRKPFRISCNKLNQKTDIDSIKTESKDSRLKQLLYRLEIGELEVNDVKQLMGALE